MPRLPEIGRSRAIALTIAATLFWPMQEVTGGMLIQNHHAAQVVWLRYATHLLLLVALVLPTRGIRAFATDRAALQILRGLCMFGMPAAYIMAVGSTSGPWIWTVFWTMPALVLAVGVLWLGERPPARAWLAVGLGAIGAALIHSPTPGGFEGSVLSLAMGVSFGGYVVLSRILRHESLAASLLYTALGAGIPISFVVARVWTPLSVGEILPIFFTGLLSILILACFDLALESAPLSLVAPLIPLVLAWELALAVPLYGASVSLPKLAGVAIVLSGVAAMLLMPRAASLAPDSSPSTAPNGREPAPLRDEAGQKVGS